MLISKDRCFRRNVVDFTANSVVTNVSAARFFLLGCVQECDSISNFYITTWGIFRGHRIVAWTVTVYFLLLSQSDRSRQLSPNVDDAIL